MKFLTCFFVVLLCLVRPLLCVHEAGANATPSTWTWITQKCAGFCKGIMSFVMYPITSMGGAFADGAVERTMNRMASRPAPSPDAAENGNPDSESNIDAITASFFKALNHATDPKNKNGDGGRFIKNLMAAAAIAVADLYNPDGEGRRALENIIKSIREFIREHGVIGETVKDVRLLITKELIELLKDFDEMNRNEGVARSAIQSVAENISQGVDQIGDSVDIGSRKVVRNVLIGSVMTIGSWYAWKHVERTLIKPRLVLETSYKNSLEKLVAFFNPPVKREKLTMVFSSELEQRLTTVAATTKSIRDKILTGQTHLTYRNLLLWGPPGTGKTMFARILAQESGMDYALMSGASFTQFAKGEGITEMNKLFDWIKGSSKGVVLFIDEAESFLGGRAGKDVSQESYQLLTNFLNLTGERSTKLMLIFATNHAQSLDPAIKRRIDDSIEMKLPTHQERHAILKLYRDKRMLNLFAVTQDFKDSVTTYLSDEALATLAQKTDGLSGGELEGIINTLLAESLIDPNRRVSREIIDRVVLHAQEKEHSFTHGFRSAHV